VLSTREQKLDRITYQNVFSFTLLCVALLQQSGVARVVVGRGNNNVPPPPPQRYYELKKTVIYSFFIRRNIEKGVESTK
jgi:hypothetical protein